MASAEIKKCNKFKTLWLLCRVVLRKTTLFNNLPVDSLRHSPNESWTVFRVPVLVIFSLWELTDHQSPVFRILRSTPFLESLVICAFPFSGAPYLLGEKGSRSF
ncbi:hypothetical protein MLD38_033297 [Melastoma candidum]|uniref:Uncharacterized protein n=1 Tax=Melastoma candidum TaxID=119954 RepID=A0ACB9M6A8_9MYRT|nr:hypothetical protein MLD38_033297 [Melastoma candidum]